MTQKIDQNTVAHIAKLARLAISESERATLANELQAMLAYVDSLNELNLDNVIPTQHPFMTQMPLRSDTIKNQDMLERLLKNAPDADGRYFRVPHIIGEEE